MAGRPTRVLQIGEDVLGAGDHVLGRIERLVVDETAHRVTHVVVGGRLVSVRRLRDAGPNALQAGLTREEFQRLPPAEHDLLSAPHAHWNAPLGYTLENFLAIAGALIGQAPYQPPVHIDLDREDVHELTRGSPVWSGRRRLGEVERVLSQPGGAVTALVVRLEGARGRHVSLPVDRVVDTVGNNVHVDLAEGEEARLPDAPV